MPILMPMPMPTTMPTTTKQKQKGLCVLIVDDNRDQAHSLSMLLENSGHDSHVCHNARDCMVLLDRLRPDVVLLDLGMPMVTGYEIAEVIKSEDDLRHIRLFAVTGHGLPLDRLQTKLIGFEQHFLKPVDFEDLERCLTSIQDQQE
ncbi:MAG: response regulator [Pirellulaceae bacterium]